MKEPMMVSQDKHDAPAEQQSTPEQPPDTRLSESQQADMQSGAGLQGGTPEQAAAIGPSGKNDKNRPSP